MRTKRFFSGLFISFAFLGSMIFFTAADIENGGGAPAAKTGSPGDGANCTGCHSGTAGQATGLITSNIPGAGYVPGTVYTITGTITDPTKNKFGFQISPQNLTGTQKGVLTVTDAPRTILVGAGKYITHTATGNVGTANAASWSFNWTAPVTGSGTVGIYGAFMASNASGSTSGDAVFLSSLMVSEDLSSGLNEISKNALSVFPSPATDFVFISNSDFNLTKPIEIQIFSLKGNLAKEEEIIPVKGQIKIGLENLADGMYILKVKQEKNIFTNRFIKQD